MEVISHHDDVGFGGVGGFSEDYTGSEAEGISINSILRS